jgi:hypothetical protein
MKNEVPEIEEKSGKSRTKKIWIILPVFLLLIIAILLLYSWSQKEKINSVKRDYNLEKEFKEIIEKEINYQKNKGISVSITNLEIMDFSERSKATIDLNCVGGSGSEIELDIFESLANALVSKYPEKYSNRDSLSWVNIECKY